MPTDWLTGVKCRATSVAKNTTAGCFSLLLSPPANYCQWGDISGPAQDRLALKHKYQINASTWNCKNLLTIFRGGKSYECRGTFSSRVPSGELHLIWKLYQKDISVNYCLNSIKCFTFLMEILWVREIALMWLQGQICVNTPLHRKNTHERTNRTDRRLYRSYELRKEKKKYRNQVVSPDIWLQWQGGEG